MPYILMLALSIHILSGVFWAGSSWTLARTGGAGGMKLFGPQMGAALAAILTGGYLFGLLPLSGLPQTILMVGAVFALIAAGAQAALIMPALSALRRGRASETDTLSRIVLAQRIAAALLALAIIAMAVARYS